MNSKPLKLHVGCGGVYLEGYLNIDAVGVDAKTHKDQLEINKTTLDKYFKKPYKKKQFAHNASVKNVVDVKAKCDDLNMFKDQTVDEILSVNLIDHFRFQDLPKVIKEWHRVLKPGGKLIVDVGDVIGNAKMLIEAKTKEETEWALRLMYCHSRNIYDSHHWGYSAKYLESLMKEWGFKQEWTKTDFIEHVYPSFQSCFIKL